MNTKWNRAYIKKDSDMLVHSAVQRWTHWTAAHGFQEFGAPLCSLERAIPETYLELVFAPDDSPLTCLTCITSEGSH